MSGAVTFSQFGGPEVLEWSEVELPEPGSGQVRVWVKAASINPFDAKVRRGEMTATFPTTFPSIPGTDVAGVVDAVGAGVTSVSVGDPVVGSASAGAYAEYALVDHAIALPVALSFELAACLPVAGEAAFRSLKQLDLVPGETLLIHGAGGSVGAIAIQLAVARDITVIGTVGAHDDDYVRSLGAVPVRYGDDLVNRVRALTATPIDAVLDTSGAGVLVDSIELAGGPDRIVTLADTTAAQYGVRFSGVHPNDRAPEALEQLVALAAAGRLDVRIAGKYPMADAAAAHRDFETGITHGKLVLTNPSGSNRTNA